MPNIVQKSFKDSYRLERVYYENMWTLLKAMKALKEDATADEITKVSELIDNAIACNESIIIIYKNLGELYNELFQKYSDLLKELNDLKDAFEEWKDEINEKIDDVNNTLMSYIRDIWARLEAIEALLPEVVWYELKNVESYYTMYQGSMFEYGTDTPADRTKVAEQIMAGKIVMCVAQLDPENSSSSKVNFIAQRISASSNMIRFDRLQDRITTGSATEAQRHVHGMIYWYNGSAYTSVYYTEEAIATHYKAGDNISISNQGFISANVPIYMIKGHLDINTADTFVIDNDSEPATYADVLSAYQAGKFIIVRVTGPSYFQGDLTPVLGFGAGGSAFNFQRAWYAGSWNVINVDCDATSNWHLTMPTIT